ncbi:MAG: winged helix DNA-binding domain-containing protein [Firmicutes bacterium]|nr:winged helix DNA-binding domain-containing protein [Bacillota bacterium]
MDRTEPVLRVSRGAARRFLVRRSGLARTAGEDLPWAGERADLVEESPSRSGERAVRAAVRHLEYVQVDPMRVIEPNHHLVLLARVDGYEPDALERCLYDERSLVEVVAYNRVIVPSEDYSFFRYRFRAIEREQRPRLSDLEPVMAVVLRRLAEEGPLSSLDLEDDRRTEGWWDPEGRAGTRTVRQALEWLWHFGRVAISHRRGGRRYFDLAERVWGEVAAPEPFEAGPPSGDQEAERDAYVKMIVPKYVRAMGLANPRASHFGWVETSAAERLALAERLVAEGEAVWVEVEGGEGPPATLPPLRRRVTSSGRRSGTRSPCSRSCRPGGPRSAGEASLRPLHLPRPPRGGRPSYSPGVRGEAVRPGASGGDVPDPPHSLQPPSTGTMRPAALRRRNSREASLQVPSSKRGRPSSSMSQMSGLSMA